jgi:hypothetical protein
MTDAEIAGYMDWRGPGAYTERQLRRIRSIVDEVQRRERKRFALECIDLVAMYGGPVELEAAIRARGQP